MLAIFSLALAEAFCGSPDESGIPVGMVEERDWLAE